MKAGNATGPVSKSSCVALGQQFTLVVPVRWAVDGLDAMTWRGIGSAGAVTPTLMLLACAAGFAVRAATRFKWEEV
jgi:ABC-2 type transport system permease protein